MLLLFVFLYFRLVVFYLIMEVVLFGVFSCVYGMDGELILFFFESECRFIMCLVSGDKIFILIDCFDDVRCIILWSMIDGLEISRIIRCKDVLFFVWF